jgi:hypothetical protein
MYFDCFCVLHLILSHLAPTVMPPRPSHKRAAESRAEGAEGASKKTRFVEPDEDPTRFADAVDAELEDVPGRRGRVRTEGYESDSSDEGEGVVRSRQPGAGTSAAAAGDDDDMFALADADAAAPGAPGADAKKDEFLRLGDIEGQEFHDDGARDAAGAESDVSEEPEDEDDAARRAKAGMGFELSGFNMRDEMEEGKFTADGAYVRSRDEHAAHDRWLDGIADKEMRRARRSKKARERAEEERQRAEERELQDIGGKIQLERDLLAMLKRGETVLEALQRLGALAKKAQKLDKGCALCLSRRRTLLTLSVGRASEIRRRPRWTSTRPTSPSRPSSTSPTSRRCSCLSATRRSTPGRTRSSCAPCARPVLCRPNGNRRPRTCDTSTNGPCRTRLRPGRCSARMVRTT